jgi:hypothetical protein
MYRLSIYCSFSIMSPRYLLDWQLILLMSEQPGGHLQIPASFNFHQESLSNSRKSPIDAQKFHHWARSDMYRSSYAHYHSPVSLSPMQESTQPRSGHLPGYSGFIPTNRAESLHAATYSNMTKQALNGPHIGANPGGLATTGRNLAR